MSSLSILLRLLGAPLRAEAILQQRSVTMTTGVRIPFTQMVSNVTAFLGITGVGFCTLIFLLGAAQLVISAGEQTAVDNGKKMMKGSLIGIGLIMGSYAIIRTTLYFLYGGTA